MTQIGKMCIRRCMNTLHEHMLHIILIINSSLLVMHLIYAFCYLIHVINGNIYIFICDYDLNFYFAFLFFFK